MPTVPAIARLHVAVDAGARGVAVGRPALADCAPTVNAARLASRSAEPATTAPRLAMPVVAARASREEKMHWG